MYYAYITQNALNNAKAEIEALKIPSQVEITNKELTQAILDSDKYKKLEAKDKALKENAIWKTRCLKKKII